MSTTLNRPGSTSSDSRRLWAMLGVIGIAVLALGAALVYIQTPPPEPIIAVLPAVEQEAATAPLQQVTAGPPGGIVRTTEQSLLPPPGAK